MEEARAKKQSAAKREIRSHRADDLLAPMVPLGRWFGLELPEGAKMDQVKAELQDGVLTVSVPMPKTGRGSRLVSIEEVPQAALESQGQDEGCDKRFREDRGRTVR